jgi:hypothetical protein
MTAMGTDAQSSRIVSTKELRMATRRDGRTLARICDPLCEKKTLRCRTYPGLSLKQLYGRVRQSDSINAFWAESRS